MARRSRAREVALQILFQEDLNPPAEADLHRADSPPAMQRFLSARLDARELIDFAWALITGVRRHRVELDTLLAKTAANWSLERMAVTDRNVLRLGAYELLYLDTPERVAINEAVELAKRFGTGQSAQFVNGVLDKFWHENRTI